MKRRFLYIVATLLLFGTTHNVIAQSKAQNNAQKYAATLYYIDNFYVDTVNTDKVVEKAIVATLKELDPHSAYISKEDVEKANEPLVGSFDGIGVSYQIVKDTILVISPIPGGPSDKVGILAGDKIVMVDNKEAFGSKVDNEYVQKLLRGPKGSKVELGIRRGDEKELLDFTVVRDKIPVNSINASFMVDSNIGYIKLDRFAQESANEFRNAFQKLSGQGMESLILDLRGNTGGYLNTAIEMVDQFLDRDKLIVYTEGIKSNRQEWKSTSNGVFTKGKLIVLIDEGSASASEILSGAVQDWDRGILIGRRSFGKGLVQRPFNLPDGSIIRLTTSRYHTPTGRCIQRPYEEGSEDYYKELTKRLEHGEYFHSDSIQFPDSLKYSTANGRIVYGGGGIMPDIFMPADTTANSKLYTNLIRKGVFNKYTLEYTMKNRDQIKKKYQDFDKYLKDFKVDEKMMNAFKEVAEKEKVKWNDEEYNKSEQLIKLQIKGLIARNVWEMEQYYQVVMMDDPALKKSIDLLRNDKDYQRILNKQ